MSGATDVRKYLDSSKTNRYASTVRGTTANTVGVEIGSIGSQDVHRTAQKTSPRMDDILVMLHTDPDSENHPNKLWRVNEVQVGYDDQ